VSGYLGIIERLRDTPEAVPLNEEHLTRTVDNLLALSKGQRQEYRRELELAAPDDPWLEHDLEALRRAEAIANAKEVSNVA
jgi:hypothetical protein